LQHKIKREPLKRFTRPILVCICIVLTGYFTTQAQQKAEGGVRLTVRGTDTNKPLPFVSVTVKEWQIQRVTNEAGVVYIPFQSGQTDSIHIVLYYVGRKSQELSFLPVSNSLITSEIYLDPLSLTLNQVEVNATRGKNSQSNSSVIIDRAAIEQIQAYSLADVLQLLPGKTIKNTDLQNKQTLTLRSVANGGLQDRNNAFGIGFYVDGVPISQNANMQIANLTHEGSTAGTFVPPASGNLAYTDGSTAGGGFDLRQMAVGNISRIEVITGVAPARYGDVSDGAVLIEREAGYAPYNFSARFQNGTTNFAVTKGWKLAGKGGVLNTSLDYINAVPDPRDRLKSYNRVNAGVLWTRFLDKRELWKNTISIDVFSTLDGGKTDDDDANRMNVKFTNMGFRSAIRGTVEMNRAWSENISYTLGGSYSEQKDWKQMFRNSGVRPVSDQLATGEHIGQFTPANYWLEQSVTGKPLSVFARLENNFKFATGNINHHISYGTSLSYDDNFGAGRQYNPLRPINTPGGYVADRPESFKDVVNLAQWGIYVQDNFSLKIGTTTLENNLGVRGDKQGKYWSFSPRYNTSLRLSRKLSLNAAVGWASKAPSLAYIYPGKAYYDIVLINSYVNDPARNLNLTYTYLHQPENTHLKPQKSLTIEAGLNFEQQFISGSVTGYYKQNRDGFSMDANGIFLELPNYVVSSRPADAPPVYVANGTKKYALKSFHVNNGLAGNTKGIELMLSTRKIKAIQTSFDLSTTYSQGRYFNRNNRTDVLDNPDFSKEAIIGVYGPGWQKNQEMISTLSTTHHLSALGFLLNFRIQAFWLKVNETSADSFIPIGYYDQQLNYHDIPEKDRSNPEYSHLVVAPRSGSGRVSQPMVYTNYHLRLAKEIKKKYKFSFYANNFLNYRPTYQDPNLPIGSLKEYNEAPSFGAEVVLKF
jgi:ferric enterobactin receptor